jgi:ribonuclease P protein component
VTATHEKDLPTSQSPAQADPRIQGSHGKPGRKKRAQTPPRQGSPPVEHRDSTQTAGLVPLRARLTFGATDRLRQSADFIRVQREGVRFQTTHFVVYGLRLAGTDSTQLGITVSRRVGKAVSRNRVKRRVRECFRLILRPMLPAGTSLVVIARKGAATLGAPAINHELRTVILSVSRKLEA